MVYYSKQIKPIAVLLNAALGCFSALAFYYLLSVGNRVLLRYNLREKIVE